MPGNGILTMACLHEHFGVMPQTMAERMRGNYAPAAVRCEDCGMIWLIREPGRN